MIKFSVVLVFLFSVIASAKSIVIDANSGTQNQLNQAQAGDTILFSPGEHDDVDIRNLVSTEDKPTVFKSQDTNNLAVIHGNIPGHPVFDIENCKYCIFENLIFEAGITGIDVKLSEYARPS